MAAHIWLTESGKSTRKADALKLVAPSGHQLVGIGLVGGIPDQAVHGAVERAMQCQRQLDDP